MPADATASADASPVARFRTLFLLFFLSGIGGLVYESIWSRYIRQFVGSAATAQVLVLALFMGGMSLGAFLAGRWVSRLRRPVRMYGLIEGAIGLYALAFPWLQAEVVRSCYDVVFPAIGAGPAIDAVKWATAALLVLPPCVALGTTFPIMSVGILRRSPARSGEILSFLYFTNSFGAAAGALLSGFVLVGRIGLAGTLAFAAALNFVILAVALRDRGVDPPLEGERDEHSVTGRPLGRAAWLLLAVAFGTGLSSFMYEIGWIRLLSMIIGSATHSFEVMLSAFILGLALGGLWVRRRMDGFRHPEVVLAVVQLVMGIAAVVTLPLYLAAVGALAWLLGDAGERTQEIWYGFNVLRYLLCLMMMLPATFCAGMTLPLLTHVLLRRGEPEGAVGRVYALNTLGAISGAILAGLVLMPLVGFKGVIVLGAMVDMGLGIFLLRHRLRAPQVPAGTATLLRRAAVCTLCVGVLGFAFQIDRRVLTSQVFRKGRFRLPDWFDVLSHVDGRSASVTVVQSHDNPGYRIIYTNGKPDASVKMDRFPADRDPTLGPDLAGDEPNQFLVGLLPLAVRPEARMAALIGFGSGVTCHTILASEALEHLDTVEIEPEMVRGASHFLAVNHRAYDDPRSHLSYDDAKAFFASAGRTYDVIVSEPTNPWVSGVASLFTVEFYREVKRYLAPQGVFAQWLQGYELSNALLLSVFAALDDEFADYLVIRIGSRDWVVLAVAQGEVARPSEAIFAWPGAREQLATLGIHDIGQIDDLVVANRRLLHPFVEGRTPNRDEVPLLDTGAERTRFFSESAEVLHSLRWTPVPVLRAFAGYEQRPYPTKGIGDFREPHILRESEMALWLLREWETPATRLPEGISVVAMTEFAQAHRETARDEAYWRRWLGRVHDVYRAVAPHGAFVTAHPWWVAVRERAATAPKEVADAVELLDALARADAATLEPLVRAALAQPAPWLPRRFLSIAGLAALELRGAPAAERTTYVEAHMPTEDLLEDDDGLAYRALRAYGLRP